MMGLQTSYDAEMKASRKYKSQTWHLVVSVSVAHVIPEEPSVGVTVVVPEECVVPNVDEVPEEGAVVVPSVGVAETHISLSSSK